MIIPKGHDYKNLLFIFTNKPYVKMIIPATNDDKKTNKSHYIFGIIFISDPPPPHFHSKSLPSISHQIKKLFTIPLLYRHYTNLLIL